MSRKRKKADWFGWIKRSSERKRMIEFNLDVPYVMRPDERQGIVNPQTGAEVQPGFFAKNRAMSDWLIRAALAAKYPEGGSKDKLTRRMNGRVHDALAQMHLDKVDVVKFSREQLEHVRDALAVWDKCIPDRQGHLVRLEDHVEVSLKRDEETEAAAKNGAAKVPETSKA